MRVIYWMATFIALAGVWGSAPSHAETAPRILAMGDSLQAWNSTKGASIPDIVGRHLGTKVRSRAASGARIIYALPISGAMGMRIESQFKGSEWDWVILNGGGNDFLLGCGCKACDGRLNRMIDKTGRAGAIPQLVAKIRRTGAQVIYLGYLRSPGRGSLIESCKDEGDAFEARLATMAKGWKGVHFLSIADLVPHGDLSFHDADRIHPSVKGSAAIAGRVVNLIRKHSSRK